MAIQINSIELAEHINHLFDRIDAWITLEEYKSAVSEIFKTYDYIKSAYSLHSISSDMYYGLLEILNGKLNKALGIK